MRRVVDRVQEDLGSCRVRPARDLLHIYHGAQRVRSRRARHQSSSRTEERFQIFYVERSVLAHFPPADLHSFALQCKPGGNVGFMIEIGYDDLFSCSQDVRDCQADQADKRSGIHTERHLDRLARIQKRRHALSGSLDGRIHFLTMAVMSTSLHVSEYEMMMYRVERHLRYLRTGSVIEKNEVVATVQGRKRLPHPTDRKTRSCHV